MEDRQKTLALINVVGGLAVLGSYAYGFVLRPDEMGALWGGVPESLRGLYTVNMFLAAFGYLVATPYIVFRLMAGQPRFVYPGGARTLYALYLAILIPSALWLPLTFAMVNDPSTALWWLIRIDLALVGIGAVGLLVMLVRADWPQPARAHVWAIAGLLPFCLQTAVLDALIWPAYFGAGGSAG